MSSETPLPSGRDPRLYLVDMLDFGRRALDYAGDLSLSEILADQMRYDAILRNLELIGEAATHVPPELRAMASDIPWRKVVGTRNRVAHAYLGIDAQTVWSILRDDLPSLLVALDRLRQKAGAT
ncbi:MAG: nucleotidyltransferase [Ideonella sp. MAG2]|nr:MAG: nucleotidyltransferase [Ideonella sp. MAG2]